MAGVQTIEEEFLTCSICTEIYTDPCTLTCGHSLCRKCVAQFVKTRPDAVQAKTIPCPFCWQVTPVPRPVRPVEEWAGQIRPSLILQGLMDRHHSGHKHQEGKDLCFQCREVGETTPASSWCSRCEITLCSRCAKMHLRAPATKTHEVSDLAEVSNIKQRKKFECKNHEGKLIKFVCKDCNKCVCHTCCLLEHAKHNFVSMEVIVPEIKSALSQKRHIIDKKMKHNMSNMRNEESNIEQLRNRKTRHQEQIKSETKVAIDLLRMKQVVLLKELSDEYDKQTTEHQANVKSCQITNQMYQQHCEFIDQALQSESELDLYDRYQVCLSVAVESDTRNTPEVSEVKFIPNMEPVKKAITEMGKVSRAGSNTLSTPVLHDTIDTRHREDTKPPYPNDMAVLCTQDLVILVVADFENKNLKAFDVMSKAKSAIKLSKSPFRVVKLERNRIASNTDGCQIIIAEVTPKLVYISTLKTKSQYIGLTSLPDSRLVAGSNSPPAVDILDLRGNVLKSFTPHNTGLNLIQKPYFLATTTEGNIIVSDISSKAMYSLTSEGGVVFTYRPTEDQELKLPQHITIANTGDILLTDMNSEKTVQLTAYGSFVRDILPSTWHLTSTPWALCFDDAGKLYMCVKEGKEPVIKVLSFK